MAKKELVDFIYKDVTTKGIYDLSSGNKAIDIEDKLSDIPKKMYDYVNNNLKGNDFVFSSYIMYMMHQNGINSDMIITDEENEFRSSVLYTDDNEFYVADPISDIKYFTNNDISLENRVLMYDGGRLITDNSAFDSSRIPLDEFYKMHGKIDKFPNFFDSDITLEEAMQNIETIKR